MDPLHRVVGDDRLDIVDVDDDDDVALQQTEDRQIELFERLEGTRNWTTSVCESSEDEVRCRFGF